MDEIQREAKLTLIIMGVLFLVVLGYYVYTKVINQKSTTFTRFKDFYSTSVFSEFSILLVIAFFVSNVIYAFNFYVMNPFVQSIFPGGDIWGQGVNILRGQMMYPGLFFQSIVVFIMSIGVLFFVIELSTRTIDFFSGKHSSKDTIHTMAKGFFWFTVITFTILIVWNIIELTQVVDIETLFRHYSYLFPDTIPGIDIIPNAQASENQQAARKANYSDNLMPYLVPVPPAQKRTPKG